MHPARTEFAFHHHIGLPESLLDIASLEADTAGHVGSTRLIPGLRSLRRGAVHGQLLRVDLALLADDGRVGVHRRRHVDHRLQRLVVHLNGTSPILRCRLRLAEHGYHRLTSMPDAIERQQDAAAFDGGADIGYWQVARRQDRDDARQAARLRRVHRNDLRGGVGTAHEAAVERSR